MALITLSSQFQTVSIPNGSHQLIQTRDRWVYVKNEGANNVQIANQTDGPNNIAGSVTNGSTAMVVSNSANIGFTSGSAVGDIVTGPGIPANTTIAAIVDATHVTLSQNANATAAGTYNFQHQAGTDIAVGFQTTANPIASTGQRDNVILKPFNLYDFQAKTGATLVAFEEFGSPVPTDSGA